MANVRVRLLTLGVVAAACGGSPSRPVPAAAPPASGPVDNEPAVAPSPQPERLAFAAVGALPAAWTLVAPRRATAAVVAGDPAPVLQVTSPEDERARVERPLDLARYRGRRVILTARTRLAGMGYRSRAVVGIDVTRGDAPRGYDDRPRSQRITPGDWADSIAVADVPGDATAAALVIEAGGGTLAVAQVTLTDAGAAGTGDEAARPLDGRRLDNVVAFARVYGAVRYFHPSDEAAAMTAQGWERFVRDGAARVEAAPDATALAAALGEIFAPVAPTLQVYPDAAPLAEPTVSSPAGGRQVSWRHHGLGITQPDLYRSERVGLSTAPVVTTVATSVPVTALRGARLRFRARMRATATSPGFDAGLWISSVSKDPAASLYTEPEQLPDLGAAWAPIAFEGVVPADATTLIVGVQAFGDGTAAIEGYTVERIDGTRVTPVKLPAWTSGAKLSPAWQVPESNDFAVEPGGAACERHRGCLAIRRTRPVAQPPWTAALGGGVSARLPLWLWHDGRRTLPAATAAPAPPSTTPLVATDRASRIAAVVIAWNVFQHFYPYFDVSHPDWPAELRAALTRSAVDDGSRAFHATLRRLVGALHDGHGFVSHDGEPTNGITPWAWVNAEGALVITRVAPVCACDLAPGDVVVSIDGVATADAIAAIAPESPMATPQHAAVIRASRLRGGALGAQRTIRVRRGTDEHEVTAKQVSWKDVGDTLDEVRPENGSEVAPGIRYVDAGNCSGEEWQKLLPDLAAATAVLIDMRGYPSDWRASPLGHLTDKPIASAQWHIPQLPRPDQEAMTFAQSDWNVEPAKPRLRRAVFLTDGRAVSAAETFMGLVEHHGLGEIVGGPTAGTNGNINPFSVPGGYSLMWTGMKVLKQDGSRHHGVGIQPTVPAAPTLAGIAAGRDEVMERAIEVAKRPASRVKPRH